MASQPETRLTLEEWAGFQDLNLTLLFTDIVDSTAIGRRLGDRRWIEDLFAHFSQARILSAIYDCYVVKVIGDSLMMAFRTSTDAIDFALEFAQDTGVPHIGIRVGINSGQVHIRENDIYGLNVNFTSRIQHALNERQGILCSNSVKRDYEKAFGVESPVRFVPWTRDLRSFGRETVYFTSTPILMKRMFEQKKARESILGPVRPATKL